MTTRKPRSARPIGSSLRAAEKKKRAHKYNAKGEHIDGHWFASAAEAERYRQLKRLEEKGAIANIELQPKFRVMIENQLMCTYMADFAYDVIDAQGNRLESHVEDVKGMITPIYRLKRKMVKAAHALDIVEVPAKSVKKWELCLPHKERNKTAWEPRYYEEKI